MRELLKKMLAYKEWANELTFSAVQALPPGEDVRERATRWESIAYTLSHVLVVDDIFRCHLTGVSHAYTLRNTAERPPVADIRRRQLEMDHWYKAYTDGLDDHAFSEVVHFRFIGGGEGAMSREDILIHVVNHGTYHRGLVSDMMCQIPAEMPANDYPVFIRDNWMSQR
ncbi:MAG: DinB family protein [Devosia sp.]